MSDFATWDEIESSQSYKNTSSANRDKIRKNFDKRTIAPIAAKPLPAIGAVPEPATGEAPNRTASEYLSDPTIALSKGVVGLGEAAIGANRLMLANPLNPASPYSPINIASKAIGAKPIVSDTVERGMNAISGIAKKSQEYLSDQFSDKQKESNKNVENAEGFVGTASALAHNPSVVGNSILESAPSMVGGGFLSRGIIKAAPKMANTLTGRLTAAAAGEGIIGASQSAEGIHQETGTLTATQAMKAMASGVGTSGFNFLGGKVAAKYGFADIDSMLAGISKKGQKKTLKDVAKAFVQGGISEGALEEMPQSMQEQMWMNAATDKPLMEGVSEAAAQGLVVGAAMGGGTNLKSLTLAKDERSKLQKVYLQNKETNLKALREKKLSGTQLASIAKDPEALKKWSIVAEDIQAEIDKDPIKVQEQKDYNILLDTAINDAVRSGMEAQNKPDTVEVFSGQTQEEQQTGQTKTPAKETASLDELYTEAVTLNSRAEEALAQGNERLADELFEQAETVQAEADKIYDKGYVDEKVVQQADDTGSRTSPKEVKSTNEESSTKESVNVIENELETLRPRAYEMSKKGEDTTEIDQRIDKLEATLELVPASEKPVEPTTKDTKGLEYDSAELRDDIDNAPSTESAEVSQAQLDTVNAQIDEKVAKGDTGGVAKVPQKQVTSFERQLDNVTETIAAHQADINDLLADTAPSRPNGKTLRAAKVEKDTVDQQIPAYLQNAAKVPLGQRETKSLEQEKQFIFDMMKQHTRLAEITDDPNISMADFNKASLEAASNADKAIGKTQLELTNRLREVFTELDARSEKQGSKQALNETTKDSTVVSTTEKPVSKKKPKKAKKKKAKKIKALTKLQKTIAEANNIQDEIDALQTKIDKARKQKKASKGLVAEQTKLRAKKDILIRDALASEINGRNSLSSDVASVETRLIDTLGLKKMPSVFKVYATFEELPEKLQLHYLIGSYNNILNSKVPLADRKKALEPIVEHIAKLQGYSTVVYNGSKNKNWRKFDSKFLGNNSGNKSFNELDEAFFTSSSKLVAETYARTQDDYNVSSLGRTYQAANIVDITIKPEIVKVDDGWYYSIEVEGFPENNFDTELDTGPIFAKKQDAIDSMDARVKKLETEKTKIENEILSTPVSGQVLKLALKTADVKEGKSFQTSNGVKELKKQKAILKISDDRDVLSYLPKGLARSDIYAFFDSNQAKSLDPITYDTKGNIIPIGERFDVSREDIMYSEIPSLQGPKWTSALVTDFITGEGTPEKASADQWLKLIQTWTTDVPKMLRGEFLLDENNKKIPDGWKTVPAGKNKTKQVPKFKQAPQKQAMSKEVLNEDGTVKVASKPIFTDGKMPAPVRDEVEFSGLVEWLTDNEATDITQEDIVAFLDESGIRLPETTEGYDHIYEVDRDENYGLSSKDAVRRQELEDIMNDHIQKIDDYLARTFTKAPINFKHRVRADLVADDSRVVPARILIMRVRADLALTEEEVPFDAKARKSFGDVLDAHRDNYFQAQSDMDAFMEFASSSDESSPASWENMTLNGPRDNYRIHLLDIPEPKAPMYRVYDQSGYSPTAALDKFMDLDPEKKGVRIYESATREDAEAYVASWKDTYPNSKVQAVIIKEDQADTSKMFQTGHFNYNNLIHIRATSRKSNLGDTLFLDEFQSDWHQQGKRKGYVLENSELSMKIDKLRRVIATQATQIDKARQVYKNSREMVWDTRDDTDVLIKELLEKYAPEVLVKYNKRSTTFENINTYAKILESNEGLPVDEHISIADMARVAESRTALQEAENVMQSRKAKYRAEKRKRTSLIHEKNQLEQGTRDLVPNAPFKGNWEKVAMKRMIMQAIIEGKTSVSWPSTPEQVSQIEGYGEMTKSEDGKWTGYNSGDVTPIIERYTEQVPKMMNEWLKQYGSKVESVELTRPSTRQSSTIKDNLSKEHAENLLADISKRQPDYTYRLEIDNPSGFGTFDASYKVVEDVTPTETVAEVQGFKITPELKEAAMNGLPMNSIKETKPQGIQYGNEIFLIAENIDPDQDIKGLVIHESGHWLRRNDPTYEKKYQELLAQAQKIAGEDTPEGQAMRKAAATALANNQDRLPEELIAEESLMYFLQDRANVELSLYKKVLTLAKQFIYKHFGVSPIKLDMSGYDMGQVVANDIKKNIEARSESLDSAIDGLDPAMASVTQEEADKWWAEQMDMTLAEIAKLPIGSVDANDGTHTNNPSPITIRRGLTNNADPSIPREGYQATGSTSSYVANSYSGTDGVTYKLELKPKTLIEFKVTKSDVSKGNEFSKVGFDERAAKLAKGEVLVARQVYDPGPRASLEADPDKLFTYPSDIYAWKDPSVVSTSELDISPAMASAKNPQEKVVLEDVFSTTLKSAAKANGIKYSSYTTDVYEQAEKSKDPIIKKWAERMKAIDPDGIAFMRDENTQDPGWVSRLLSSPEYRAKGTKAAELMVRAAEYADELKAIKQKEVLGEFSELARAFKKALPKDYAKAGEYLREGDRTGKGFKIAFEDGQFIVRNAKNEEVSKQDSWTVASEDLITAEQQYLKGRVSKDTREFIKMFRELMDRSLKAQNDDLQNQIDNAKKYGLEEPRVGDPDSPTLSEAIAQSYDLQGTYFPRVRQNKKFYIRMEKDGAPDKLMTADVFAIKNKNSISLVNKTKELMNNQAPVAYEIRKYQKEGYTVTEIEPGSQLAEDLYDTPGLISSIDALLGQAEDLTLEDEMSAMQRLNNLITQKIADIYKVKGNMSSKKSRSESYTEGFEEDPIKAAVSHAQRIAAGMAKRQTARDMLLAFTGRTESYPAFKKRTGGKYKEYKIQVAEQKIDPRLQKNLYSDMKLYMQHVLKPSTKFERALGYLKAFTVVKFLGFRVSSAAINMSNMIAAVPATISAHTGLDITESLGLVSDAASKYAAYRFENPAFKGYRNSLKNTFMYSAEKSIKALGTTITKPVKLSDEDHKVFSEISYRGWDEAHFNIDATKAVQDYAGETYNNFVGASMYMFGAAERANRAMTIFAAYQAHKKQLTKSQQENLTDTLTEELLQKAKHTSDRSHGSYGKATKPWLVQKYPILDLPYMFGKFQHNYVLNMLEQGMEYKSIKGALYMLAIPGVIAGAGASVLSTPAFAILGLLSSLSGGAGDDPEEEFYTWLEKHLPKFVADSARLGVAGMLGVNFKGSMQSPINEVSKLKDLGPLDLGGAPMGVLIDGWDAIQYARYGEYSKAIEKAIPSAFAAPIKAHRLATEGYTSQDYAPAFYGQEQLKISAGEIALMSLSFNPARVSAYREKQWSEKQTKVSFAKDRADMRRLYKRALVQSSKLSRRQAKTLVDMIDQYNYRVSKSDPNLGENYLTWSQLHSSVMRSQKPSKLERTRQ